MTDYFIMTHVCKNTLLQINTKYTIKSYKIFRLVPTYNRTKKNAMVIRLTCFDYHSICTKYCLYSLQRYNRGFYKPIMVKVYKTITLFQNFMCVILISVILYNQNNLKYYTQCLLKNLLHVCKLHMIITCGIMQ